MSRSSRDWVTFIWPTDSDVYSSNYRHYNKHTKIRIPSFVTDGRSFFVNCFLGIPTSSKPEIDTTSDSTTSGCASICANFSCPI